ncbi:secreted protein [Peziza echinospora]|nr:secreted protein [Peziza echinospora]
MQYSLTSSLVALSTLALSAFAAPVAEPQVGIIFPPTGPFPDPGSVFIKNVKYAGTGCPAGTVAVSSSDDKTNVVLAFDSYVASIGPDVAPADNRKNCLINFNIEYPSGWSYTIYSTDYRGYVNIDPKVTALQKSTYYFSSTPGQFEAQSTWTGPFSDDYYFTDTFDAVAVVWSPCKSATNTLNINTQIRLTTTDKKASGLITTDTITHKVTHVLGVAWQKC